MKHGTRVVALVLVFLLISAVAIFAGGEGEKKGAEVQAFTQKAPEEYVGQLTDWRHTKQVEWFIANFNKVYPNVKVNNVLISPDVAEYTQKVLNAASSGVNAPDLFTAWSMTIGQVKDSGLWENLSAAPYNAEELAKELVPYTVDLARDKDGNIRALSFQATIGGMYYRRSIAREYLGTDDPAEVGKMVSTFEGMLAVAKTIHDKSGGKIAFMNHPMELTPMIEANRDVAWVNEKNELIIEPIIYDYFDWSKKIRDGGFDAKIKQFTPAYYGTMQNGTTFAYFLPTWGLNNNIAPNAPDTKGDWAVTNAPMPYVSGGIWVGIYSGSKNKELAWEYLKYSIFDDEHLFKIGTEQGFFVSKKSVQDTIANEVKSGGAVDFLGGQNPYTYFKQYIDEVDYKLFTKYDNSLRNFLDASIDSFITGKMTKEQAIASFKSEIKNAYPELIVK